MIGGCDNVATWVVPPKAPPTEPEMNRLFTISLAFLAVLGTASLASAQGLVMPLRLVD